MLELDGVTEAWDVDLADFPPDAGTDELLRFVVRYAILAPSPHNLQPWLFDVHDSRLDLYGDMRRGLAVVDPDDRELIMSCGAAATNIRLALARLGYRTHVNALPDARDPYLLAELTLSGAADPTDDDVLLFDQIPRRHTNRTAFEPRPLPPELIEQLVADAAGAGASFVPLTEDQLSDVARMVMAADRDQMASRRFRRELASSLVGLTPRRDGMPAFATELGGLRVPSPAVPLVVRTFDMGKGRAARDRELVEHSGLLAVIGGTGDDVPGLLAAGQALQRVLLRARAHEVWASFLNQPIEVDELRRELADDLHCGEPQLLLRLGYGAAPRPVPRRRLDEFFVR